MTAAVVLLKTTFGTLALRTLLTRVSGNVYEDEFFFFTVEEAALGQSRSNLKSRPFGFNM